MFNNLTLPKYSEIAKFDGKGNWAVKKYYQWPYRPFYRHKLKMALDLIQHERFNNILDYGCGPGILTPELRMRGKKLMSIDKFENIDQRWKFDLIVCSSVLEFLDISDLRIKMSLFNSLLDKGGTLLIASPMETKLTDIYFNVIGDNNYRQSHGTILYEASKYFKLIKKKFWMNLYFAARLVKK